MGTHLKLTASDGHKFGAYRVDPAGTPKGGIVVIQEIFGVNRHIRSVADRFAALGYVAIAPALFDRIEAGFECGYSPEEVQGAMRFVANLPTMLHFGELDAHIPMSDVETIKSKQPSVDVYTYNADHGFQCDERDSFAPEAAQIAWGRTLRFIDSHM